MSEDQAMAAGRRRSRGAQDTARAGALERLKALRSGGRRSTEAGSDRFQVKIEDPIYDTIDENEYEALVAKRRESVKEFIVDDDGLGYGDEGEEVDWSIPGARHSSDESEGETERVKRKKKNKSVENGSLEKEQQNQAMKNPSALSAAAALMGKQRISSMFTSSIFKKNKDDSKGKNLSCDSIVDDVIAEFAPDEADRDRRRRGNSNLASHVKNFSSAKSPIAYVKAESPAIDNVNVCFEEETKGLTDSINEPVPAECLRTEVSVEKDLHCQSTEFREDKLVDVSDCSRKEKSVIEEQLNVLEVEAKPAPVKVEEMKTFKLNAKINEEKKSMPSATAGWQAVRSTGNGAENCDNPETNHSFNCEDKTDIEVDSDGSMPFYILDAYEEIYGANAGIIYLFGKDIHQGH